MSTITKVQNYKGNNSFIVKMKEVLTKYNYFTPKQVEIINKILPDVKMDVETLPENLKMIAKYDGSNSFVLSMKDNLMTYGRLTEKQTEAAIKQINKENNTDEELKRLKLPVKGDTLMVRRYIGQELKQTYNLNFNPILLDVVEITGVNKKVIRVKAKMTIKRGDICMCCGRTLTDEFSMLTKLGSTCAKHIGITYIKDVSEAERLREDYLKKVEEIGIMEVVIPIRQIKIWEGKGNYLIESITESF
jgi:hypothetical protein